MLHKVVLQPTLKIILQRSMRLMTLNSLARIFRIWYYQKSNTAVMIRSFLPRKLAEVSQRSLLYRMVVPTKNKNLDALYLVTATFKHRRDSSNIRLCRYSQNVSNYNEVPAAIQLDTTLPSLIKCSSTKAYSTQATNTQISETYRRSSIIF
jgi:hypothetical protein